MFSIIGKETAFLENFQGYAVTEQNKLCSTVHLLLQFRDFRDKFRDVFLKSEENMYCGPHLVKFLGLKFSFFKVSL